MVSATNNLQPAQLSHLTQSLVQIAVDCLELDSSEILHRSLDGFIEHELKSQVNDWGENLSCRYSKNNIYARVYKVLLQHYVSDTEEFDALESVSLADQKEKLQEIGVLALDLLKKVLAHLAPANNFDLSQWDNSASNLPGFLASDHFKTQVESLFGSDLDQSAKSYNSLLKINSTDLKNLYVLLVKCIKGNFAQVQRNPFYCVQARSGGKHGPLLAKSVRSILLVDFLLQHLLDAFDSLHGVFKLEANIRNIITRIGNVRAPVTRSSVPITLQQRRQAEVTRDMLFSFSHLFDEEVTRLEKLSGKVTGNDVVGIVM